ncbi:hypothetical protein [Sphingomonas morindae]|uniref:Phage tail tape measure protein n=1 Tax=Sphingomonas morindae TaxID=1541170 RepID=A0ABY4X747_9SPHN|nr:hypothetical protein [Sphingomonas morindae]USI72730.1 hypothetical protein LHA26_15875 [Sphingomonas morindae]
MAGAGDLMIRVNFTGTDRLSRLLERIAGTSRAAGRALTETNRTLDGQRRALAEVGRALGGASGNVTHLIERERALRAAVERSTRLLERRVRLTQIEARTRQAQAAGDTMMARGQGSLFGLTMLASPLLAMARAGAEVEATQNRMRMLGLSDGAVRNLTAYAQAMDIAGSSTAENLRYLQEAQGVFRESGEAALGGQLAAAKRMAPLLAKLHVVTAASGAPLSDEQSRYFLRFIEQAGGLTSPERAASLTNGLFRALQSSGGAVQPSDYQAFMARAGIAAAHLTERALFGHIEPLIAEQHEAAGVGLATAFKMASGIKANSRAAAEFVRLGLWDRSRVRFNSLGGVRSTRGNPLTADAAAALQHDPVEFHRDFVLPAYARAGIRTGEARAFENARLFGSTGGNLFNLIDKQMATLLRSGAAYARTQSLDQAYATVNQGFFGEQGKLRAGLKDFMVAAGAKGGLLDSVVRLMRMATSALRAFTALGQAHPTAFAWLGSIVMNLLLMRGALAIARIAFGGLLGPAARVIGLFAKIRAEGSVAAAFPLLGAAARLARRGLGLLGGALSGAMRLALLARVPFGLARAAAMMLGRGVLRAGLMMLASPMVLAIATVIAALALLAFQAYRHWDKVKRAFAGALRWMASLPEQFTHIGAMMLEGLIGMLSPARLIAHVTALAKGAVSAFRQVLGIHSPSRVFAGLGEQIASGLALGIGRGAPRPLARTRALGVALAAAAILPAAASANARRILAAPVPAIGIPPMAAMAGVAARGAGDRSRGRGPAIHQSFHVTIHVTQQPGQDARARPRGEARARRRGAQSAPVELPRRARPWRRLSACAPAPAASNRIIEAIGPPRRRQPGKPPSSPILPKRPRPRIAHQKRHEKTAGEAGGDARF